MTGVFTLLRTFTLKQARLYSGLTQKEVSEELNMTEKTYIQYEKYRREFKISHAIKFSEITGIPFQNIIFFDRKVHL